MLLRTQAVRPDGLRLIRTRYRRSFHEVMGRCADYRASASTHPKPLAARVSRLASPPPPSIDALLAYCKVGARVDPVRLVLARIASQASGQLAPDLLAVIATWSEIEWRRLLVTALQESLLTWVVNRVVFFGLPCPASVLDDHQQIIDNGRAAAYYGARLCLHVLSLMEQAGIEARIIKGHCVGQYLYGDAALRDSRDVDLVVQPADAACAANVLAKAGFAPQVDIDWFKDSRFLKSNREASFKALRGTFEVDLHWALSYRWVPELLNASQVLSKPNTWLTIANKSVPWFDPVMLFLIHASNIISSQHVEMKAHTDVALIFDKLTIEQWRAVETAFEQVGANVALRAITAALRDVFGRTANGLGQPYPKGANIRRMQSNGSEVVDKLIGHSGLPLKYPSFWSNARYTNSWKQMGSLLYAMWMPSSADYSGLPTGSANSTLMLHGALRRLKKHLLRRSHKTAN